MLGEIALRSERRADRRQDERRVLNRLQPDPPDAVLPFLDHLRRGLDCHARLARAAGPGQGQHPTVFVPQQPEHLAQLLLSPDERSRLQRQVRLVQRLQRRELRVAHLVERLRSRQVLQAVQARAAADPHPRRRASSAPRPGPDRRARPSRCAPPCARRRRRSPPPPAAARRCEAPSARESAPARAPPGPLAPRRAPPPRRRTRRRTRRPACRPRRLRATRTPPATARRCCASDSAYPPAPSSCSSARRALDVREEKRDGAGRKLAHRRNDRAQRPGLGNGTCSSRRSSLDLDPRQPLQPARQVPVPVTEQAHRRRQEHRADDVASIRSATAIPKPICWNMTRSPIAKPPKTATMISAAPVMSRAVDETPWTTASVVEPRLVVALLDPAEQEHLVVHREAEQDREQEQRHPGLDRVDALEAEQPAPDPVVEDEHDEPVGGPDREQVEHDRGGRDHDRAEHDRQEHEAQAEHEDEHDRQPGVHRVDEVDVVGRVAADDDVHVGAREGAAGSRPSAGAGSRPAPSARSGRRRPARRSRPCRRPARRAGRSPRTPGRARARAAAARSRPAPAASARFRRPRSAPGSSSPAGSRARAPRSPASTRAGRAAC